MNEHALSPSAALVSLEEVVKEYRRGRRSVIALDGVSVTFPRTGMIAIVGPSGSGKSTLLHLIGAMDRATSGRVSVANQDLGSLASGDLTRFRRETVGFVFQQFNLIPNLSALENVILPMEFARRPREARRARARELLTQVGLGDRLSHRPAELSGGELQRVAIARALANDPRLVLADEPTGNLDSKTGHTIYALLREVAVERAVIVVTHAEALAAMADVRCFMKDGRINHNPN